MLIFNLKHEKIIIVNLITYFIFYDLVDGFTFTKLLKFSKR